MKSLLVVLVFYAAISSSWSQDEDPSTPPEQPSSLADGCEEYLECFKRVEERVSECDDLAEEVKQAQEERKAQRAEENGDEEGEEEELNERQKRRLERQNKRQMERMARQQKRNAKQACIKERLSGNQTIVKDLQSEKANNLSLCLVRRQADAEDTVLPPKKQRKCNNKLKKHQNSLSFVLQGADKAARDELQRVVKDAGRWDDWLLSEGRREVRQCRQETKRMSNSCKQLQNCCSETDACNLEFELSDIHDKIRQAQLYILEGRKFCDKQARQPPADQEPASDTIR